MSDSLNTERAAAFLGVSEASVRRWSDQGLLPVRRSGRRRARRFAEEDLQKFAAGVQGGGGEPSTGNGPADSAMLGRVRVKVHAHLPSFYDSDEGRLRIAVPFLRDGLIAGQRCFLYAFDEPRNQYLDALKAQDGLDVESALKSGQLVLVPAARTAVRHFLEMWEQRLWESASNEPHLLRVVGEMTTVRNLFPAEAEMPDFEVGFSAVIRRFPVVVLCQYDAREFDGHSIIAAAKAHPDLFDLRLSDFLT
jgi:hypothetical protein